MKSLELIYESEHSRLYVDDTAKNGKPVVVKILQGELPPAEKVQGLQQEYEISSTLSIEGIRKALKVSQVDGHPAIFLEYVKGETLFRSFVENRKALDEILFMAIKVTQTLAELHDHSIVHLDINPNNIMWMEASQKIKIIDLGYAIQLAEQVLNPAEEKPSQAMMGTLAYMPPEQSGRMNQEIDFRSDLYSWGISLYEVLTGKLPFICDDPAELIHSHLAVAPIPLDQVNTEVPSVLSQIVMRLLAKDPEDRYQTASGLEADLVKCWEQLKTDGEIGEFEIGTADFGGKFHVSTNFFGREKELKLLKNSFQRVKEGNTEIVLIQGYEGTGKTRLVRELREEVIRSNGFFIEGDFDPLRQNQPYAGWILAFEKLMDELLTENEEVVKEWRNLILEKIGNQGHLLTEVIPRLALITGEQEPVSTSLGAREKQVLFNRVFHLFIDAMSVKEHPLVVFLDDWQWADIASVGVLQTFLERSHSDYIQLICAYRGNEIMEGHPFKQILDSVKGSKIPFHNLQVQDLSQGEVAHLVADTLHCPEDHCQSLVEVIYEKTHGNVFFVRQMLDTLYNEGLIVLERGKLANWEIAKIQQQSISDNVGELMASKLRKLESDTLDVLQYASILGDNIPIKQLQELVPYTEKEFKSKFNLLVKEGLLLKSKKGKSKHKHCRFAHHSIRKVAYELMNSSRRQALHFHAGQKLLEEVPEGSLGEKIFDIVYQLNKGIKRNWTEDQDTKTDQETFDPLYIAKLNLKAAQRAKSAMAFEPAMEYLVAGVEHLGPESWDKAHTLTYKLYFEWAEIAYLNGDFELAEVLIQASLKKTQGAMDKVSLYNLLIVLNTMQGAYRSAFYAGKQALRHLGFSIQEEESEALLSAKFDRVDALVVKQDLFELMSAPGIQNQHISHAIRILTNIESAADLGFDRNLWALTVLKAAYLCLRYGNVAESAYVYTVYAQLLGTMKGEYGRGYQFGLLALHISEKQGNPVQFCKASAKFAGVVQHWRRPLKYNQKILEQGLKAGLEVGEMQYSSYILMIQVSQLFAQGATLTQVEKKVLAAQEHLQKNQNPVVAQVIEVLHYFFRNLIKDPNTKETDQKASEQEILQNAQDHNNQMAIAIYYIFSAAYHFNFYAPHTAWEAIQTAHPYLQAISGMFQESTYYFYRALILLSQQNDLQSLGQEDGQGEVDHILQRFHIWAENCPENFQHKLLLIQAEKARRDDDFWEAGEYYDKAIIEASKNGFTQDEALANELAAKFWLNNGKQEFARPYMLKAHYHYARWGAKSKQAQLEKRFSQFFIQSNRSTSGKRSSGNQHVDAATILKASQALSGEIVLSNLLRRLMRILMENAGAVRGILIEKQEIGLVVQARGDMAKGVRVLEEIPIEKAHGFAKKVVNYVARTQKELVINDASEDATYNQDPHIISEHVKSIACLPINNQGELSAIIYLENNFVQGAFNPKRLEILRVLSGQVAISLENANLYERLEEKVRMRTKELDEKNSTLTKTLKKLQETQAQLVDSAKMASLGQLTAGIAHEINNPINFVSGNINPLKRDFEDIKGFLGKLQALKAEDQLTPAAVELVAYMEDVDAEFIFEEIDLLLNGIEEGANRTKNIVTGLSTFSRSFSDAFKSENIHDGLDSTLMLLTSKLKGKIEVEKDYGKLPLVSCIPSKLNQVFMNILSNAADALSSSDKGDKKIVIRTYNKGKKVFVHLKDNGPGIPTEIKERIFEPFFTTKDVGKGTGLGLAISYGIIEEHQGKIQVESEPGEGTEFIITLPIEQK